LLNPDFRDILSMFCDEGVEFLVVGAYAMAAHGYPRATGDLDLWIRPSGENAGRVWRALARFGAPLTEVKEEDFKTMDLVFQVGVAPRRIDIQTAIDGVEFSQAWADRNEIDVGGLRVHVLSRLYLIQNKKASGRPQDRADVFWLEGQEE
jgi:hypothetical protein